MTELEPAAPCGAGDVRMADDACVGFTPTSGGDKTQRMIDAAAAPKRHRRTSTQLAAW
jgi:hypothetical protein